MVVPPPPSLPGWRSVTKTFFLAGRAATNLAFPIEVREMAKALEHGRRRGGQMSSTFSVAQGEGEFADSVNHVRPSGLFPDDLADWCLATMQLLRKFRQCHRPYSDTLALSLRLPLVCYEGGMSVPASR
jgi:hypothetical protein